MIRRTSLSAGALLETRLHDEMPPIPELVERQWRLARQRAICTSEESSPQEDAPAAAVDDPGSIGGRRSPVAWMPDRQRLLRSLLGA